MIKKKSRTLAFILAASLIMPTVEGTVLAATNEESGVVQEVSNEATNTEDSNSTEAPEEKPIFESGDGKEATPYIINSLEQLKAFRDSVNTGNTYEGKYIKLTASVDLSGENWEPIGRGDKPFLGDFDGGSNDGVVISNLKIVKGLSNVAKNNYIGLFGKVGTNLNFANEIKNITIKNVDITGSCNVGAVVGDGCISNGLSNINLEGDIKIKGYWYVGGISGGQYSYFSITNSNIKADKGSFVKGVRTGSGYIGGIIGQRGEGNFKISNCYIKNIEVGGADRLGGISGCLQYGNTIEKCTVEDTIIRQNQLDESADTLGTIAGANQATENIQNEYRGIKILGCVVKNTYAYLRDSNEPITQKISMLNNEGAPVEKNVIVGNNVNEKDGKVVDGEFEILTSDMYDSNTLKLGDIGNDRYILVPKDTVAIVGEKTYSSLEEAIENCPENGNIKLVDKVEITDTIKIDNKKSITIDFNKQEVKASANFNGDSLINIEDSTGISLRNGNFVVGDKNRKAIELNNSYASMNGDFKATTDGKENVPVMNLNGSKVDITDLDSINGKEKDDLSDNEIVTNNGNIIDNENSTPSYPSYPSTPTYTHEEIIGSDRYDTAARIADKLGSYDNVVLVNAESSMSDGLSASSLAGKENGAILLTKKDSIPKATMDRLKKVKKVYIIGGEAAISQKVSDEITKNVPNVKIERLGGKTRVETSEIVAKKLGNYSDAFVVNGFEGEADAMSASAIAAKKGAPILLTNGKTSTHAKKSGVEYYVIGGNSVVDKSIADKYNAEVLAGKDRYATNKEVINEFYSGSDKVYIANGDKLVDALTASPLAKKDGIVLVNEKSDKSILKGKDTVQVGGMDFEIEFEK